MDDVVAHVRRRIERARETLAALGMVNADASPENVAALHRIHARHQLEDGNLTGAVQAEVRARRAEALGRPMLLTDDDLRE